MQTSFHQTPISQSTTLRKELYLQSNPLPKWTRYENIERNTFWEFLVSGCGYIVREGQTEGDWYCGPRVQIPNTGNSTVFASQSHHAKTKKSHRTLKNADSVQKSLVKQILRRESNGYVLIS